MADNQRALATQDNIKALFAKNIKALHNTVGNKPMANRLINLAVEGVRKVPDLQKCDADDVFNKLRQTVELGLEAFTPLHHAVLLPFKNTKFNRYDCTLIVEYQGLIKLAKNSGEVADIYASVVYENEPYEYEEGLNKTLKHTPMPVSRRGENKIAAYAVCVFKDGSKTFEWMWAEDILAVKNRSRAKDKGPWVTDEEQMWKKTVIRRMSKKLPLSSAQFNIAANIDEKEEFGFENAIDVTPAAAEKKQSLADQVKPKAKNENQRPRQEQSSNNQRNKSAPASSAKNGDQNACQTLHDNILAYVDGDIEKADKIAQKVTEWNGKGLTVDEILNANPKRCERGLENFEKYVEVMANDGFPADA